MRSPKYPTWQKRLNVFNQTVDEYLIWLDGNTPSRKQTAATLLTNLKRFTQRQFDRFIEFQAYLDKGRSTIIPFLMPDTAFNLILDQAFTDFSVIQQAIGQRLIASTCKHLGIADKLAWLALQPARGSLDFENTTVLTYLHKSTNVRLIPYAPVAVVGIPYTGNIHNFETGQFDLSAAVAQDYLSIPHEIGHHVYWHGTTNPSVSSGKTHPMELVKFLKNELVGEHDFVARWVEEIFADR
jgi:hypothetical protein